MADIVERLRDRSQCWEVDGVFDDSLIDAQMDREAADEIERLRVENRRLHMKLMVAYSEAAGMYDEVISE